MLAHSVLDRFDDHYCRAATIMRAQRELLAIEVPDMAALARNRWELLRALVEFQIFKHRDIFDPVIRDGTPSESVRAHMLKTECTTLGADIRAFVAAWSNGSADRQWPMFRAEAIALIDRIERGLADQREAVSTMVAPKPAATAPATPRFLHPAKAGAAG